MKALRNKIRHCVWSEIINKIVKQNIYTHQFQHVNRYRNINQINIRYYVETKIIENL